MLHYYTRSFCLQKIFDQSAMTTTAIWKRTHVLNDLKQRREKVLHPENTIQGDNDSINGGLY